MLIQQRNVVKEKKWNGEVIILLRAIQQLLRTTRHFYLTKLLDKRVTPLEPDHELVLHSVDEAVTLLSQEYQVEAVMPLGYY